MTIKQIALIGTVLIIALLFQSCESQESAEDSPPSLSKAEQIDALIGKFAAYGQFNGAALVADSGEVIFKKAYGMANMEWDVPNATDTKFRLASVSKQFTAMLAVQLAAENKLDLNAPISNYLPDFPKDKGDIITAHHLLTHTSGLPSYTNFNNYRELMLSYYSPEELVAQFADSALVFEPGFRFDYSNSGYSLLGYLIETITGETYGEVLQNQIFEPLGMKNSGYDSHRDIIKNRADGYYKNGLDYINASYIDMSVAYAAGGLYSTVEDLYLWDQALYTDKLLPQLYKDLLFEKHASTGGHHYGYGWNKGIMYVGNTDEKIRIIDHDGVINGFTSCIIRMPDTQASIILLNNTGSAPLNAMSIAIAAILTNNSYDMPQESLAEVIYHTIDKEGLASGLAYFEANKEKENYYLNEGEFNLLGYAFLQDGKAEEAAALFKINVDAYPTSFNVFDSYAEAILTLGDTVEAIKYYEKSIQMNPGNDNGIRVLKTINP